MINTGDKYEQKLGYFDKVKTLLSLVKGDCFIKKKVLT